MARFFFEQAEAIVTWHNERMEEMPPQPGERQAGYGAIKNKFGFLLELHGLSGGDMEKEDFILMQPVYRVYTKLQLENNLEAARRRQQAYLEKRKR